MFDFETMTKTTKNAIINFTLVFSIIGGFNYLMYKYYTYNTKSIEKKQPNKNSDQITIEENLDKQLDNQHSNSDFINEKTELNEKNLDKQYMNLDTIGEKDFLDKKEKLIFLYNKLIKLSSLLNSLKSKIN